MGEIILICENSQEGIFTAIYEAYAQKFHRDDVFLQIGEEGDMRLFAEYVRIEADAVKAGKVASTILRKMGEKVYWDICCVLASEDVSRAQAVYRTIVTALDSKKYYNVMSDVKDPYILKAFELSRNVGREIDHLYGFLRFQETENGVLYAKVGPKNNIVTLVAPHFMDRFPQENFVIHDDIRQLFVLCRAGKGAVVLTGEEAMGFSLPEDSQSEKYYQYLFKKFCKTIAIEERKNLILQRNMLPIRFQDYMVEFAKK